MSREFLQALLDARGDGGKLCQRCGCCELVSEECEQCNEGLDGHDCGEDCCCCLDPEDNIPCQFCRGRGYFEVCLGGCNERGEHREANETGSAERSTSQLGHQPGAREGKQPKAF